MGEIKSTLDIIMEKTRGLTMTEEEKKAIQKDEVQGKVRGLLQKFLDRLIPLEGVKNEIAAFSEERRNMAKEAFIKECMDRIDPEADNTPFLDVLEKVAGMDPAPFHNILLEFQNHLEQQKEERKKVLEESLKARGISGSAVIPNINADSEWVRYVSEIREGFNVKLTSLRKKFDVNDHGAKRA